jgi:type II secretory pathway component PulF
VTPSPSKLGILDAVSVGLLVCGLLALWAFQWAVVPTFRGMFRDFGSDASLPAVTLLVLQPIAAACATGAAIVAMCSGLALRLAARPTLGALLLVFALVVPLATVPLMLAALYAPIYQLAGQIRSD